MRPRLAICAYAASVALLFAAVPTIAAPASTSFNACFAYVGHYYHVSPSVLRAIARHESHFDRTAFHKNRDGSFDIGIMQINSSWFPTLRRSGIDPDELLRRPCINIAVGAWILRQNILTYGYTWTAVGAYNARTPWKRLRYERAVAQAMLADLSEYQSSPIE